MEASTGEKVDCWSTAIENRFPICRVAARIRGRNALLAVTMCSQVAARYSPGFLPVKSG